MSFAMFVLLFLGRLFTARDCGTSIEDHTEEPLSTGIPRGVSPLFGSIDSLSRAIAEQDECGATAAAVVEGESRALCQRNG
jgi:hypothetical protein